MGIFDRFKGGISEDAVREALKAVQDPDLHRDIVSLGFVKKVDIKGKKVHVVVELTTPACPVKEQLQAQCREVVEALEGVDEAHIEMTAQTPKRRDTIPDLVKEALGGVKSIIAVASGKGGVGKSTSTVNLAYGLAQAGSKVGILDADIYGPSMMQMTKVGKPEETRGQLIVPPQFGGVKIISVGMFTEAKQAQMLRGPMVAQIIRQFLTQIDWGELDYLLIDYPPGTGDIQLTLSQIAPITGAVVVTTPQEVALIDVRKAISMFDTLKVPVLGVVETMSYFICDGCEKKHYIFREGGGRRVAKEHGLPMIGEIPIEPKVAADSDDGKPLVISSPDSIAAKAYLDAAGQVAAQQSIVSSQSEGALSHFKLEWE
ncbi:Mrp/NBP35 family ATP-binding protein [Pseudobacteriovorax antillogorgiicola]|uniref:Iron-sulfur cluster carrier protein n=1 Tax=Pseudobacteriovorax antillogorgiicola TaxID=1513793 RepID=A0A1Y6CJ38_9BACT|nr:Mrp/NBP35 family ATP-binding protein [Pseudobacteriovorax antillogorgiicola]TCS46634.1 ATP-binding protein involved in chromosome partitioning [Pseudobacteriovorax antillogorgiicola]SMF66173.1 ATP-binding protein involved in chromosome partitioning [Pseudobacteriovorax antillogorgiicola]